jgi:general secretion pathway protein G
VANTFFDDNPDELYYKFLNYMKNVPNGQPPMKTQEKADVSHSRDWTSRTLTEDAPEQRSFLFSTRGFSLIELLVVVAILGILANMALPALQDYKNMANASRCQSEIRMLDNLIAVYVIDRSVIPPLISDLPMPVLNDPWGHPYVYYNIINNTPVGSTRYKDIDTTSNLNDDYDLYSLGRDGITSNILSDSESLNDIVRVNNGSSVELGSKR